MELPQNLDPRLGLVIEISAGGLVAIVVGVIAYFKWAAAHPRKEDDRVRHE